jgi:hypothetical protein
LVKSKNYAQSYVILAEFSGEALFRVDPKPILGSVGPVPPGIESPSGGWKKQGIVSRDR